MVTPKARTSVTKKITNWLTDDAALRPKSKDFVEAADETGSPILYQEKGVLRIRPANSDELLSFRNLREKPVKEFNVIVPNLDKIKYDAPKYKMVEGPDGKKVRVETTSEDALKQAVAATFEMFKNIEVKKVGETTKVEPVLRQKRTFQDVIKDASLIGSPEIMGELFKQTAKSRALTDSELTAARNTVMSLVLHTEERLKSLGDNPSIEQMLEVADLITMQGYAVAQLTGEQSKTGMMLAVNRILAGPSKSRVDAINRLIDTFGPDPTMLKNETLEARLAAYDGEAGLKALLSGYSRLPMDATKVHFAKKSITRRGLEMFSEIFQTSLISNPLTHTFNFASQAVFLETLMMEKFIQGEFRDGFSMLKAHATYFPQAIRAGLYALYNEEAITDKTTKFDTNFRSVSREGAGLRTREEGAGLVESAAGSFFNGFGVMMRLYGYRPMLAMDEIFKTYARGMQIEMLSHKAKSEAYQASLAVGETKEVAGDKARAAYLRAKESETTFNQASDFARMATFQDELPEGVLANLQGWFSHPLTKIWVPFYKTPTQIIRRITERTPVAILMPSIQEKLIRGSAAERKETLARIMLGTGMMGTVMMMSRGQVSEDIVITGYGPTNYKERSNWLETNEPYSIGIKQKDGSWKFVSYKRYDPLSGILAAAADTAYTIEMSDDTDSNESLILNLGMATSRYVTTSLPMTQFIGEMVELAQGASYGDPESKMTRVLELLTKQATSAVAVVGQQVATVGLAPQGFMGTIERYRDPVARSVTPSNQYPSPVGTTQAMLRGVYESINYVVSRTPGLSSALPERVNRWNETIQQTQGLVWETYMPFRVVNKRGANILNKELEDLGLGFGSLPHSMNEAKIRLNGKQYKRYVELYNNPSQSMYFDGDEVDGPLEEMIEQIEEYQGENLTTKQRIQLLRNIDSEYKTIAKKLMFLEFPELSALKRQRDAVIESTGKPPAVLRQPTEREVTEEQLRQEGIID